MTSDDDVLLVDGKKDFPIARETIRRISDSPSVNADLEIFVCASMHIYVDVNTINRLVLFSIYCIFSLPLSFSLLFNKC